MVNETVEPIPTDPMIRLMQDLARENNMVMVVPIYELDMTGVLLQHRGGDRRPGNTLAGVSLASSRTATPGSGRSSTSSWQPSATRCFKRGSVGRRVYSCYDRHFP